MSLYLVPDLPPNNSVKRSVSSEVGTSVRNFKFSHSGVAPQFSLLLKAPHLCLERNADNNWEVKNNHGEKMTKW